MACASPIIELIVVCLGTLLGCISANLNTLLITASIFIIATFRDKSSIIHSRVLLLYLPFSYNTRVLHSSFILSFKIAFSSRRHKF